MHCQPRMLDAETQKQTSQTRLFMRMRHLVRGFLERNHYVCSRYRYVAYHIKCDMISFVDPCLVKKKASITRTCPILGDIRARGRTTSCRPHFHHENECDLAVLCGYMGPKRCPVACPVSERQMKSLVVARSPNMAFWYRAS